ncbi:MAG TPA: hypothetical protein VK427_16930 [Kofleriaceae bacterium]|nr:hypothetical protein [Kofleriaceae bacterium]
MTTSGVGGRGTVATTGAAGGGGPGARTGVAPHAIVTVPAHAMVRAFMPRPYAHGPSVAAPFTAWERRFTAAP